MYDDITIGEIMAVTNAKYHVNSPEGSAVINEAVASKLFGDDACHYPGHFLNECYKKSGLCSWPPNYCHSIEAAWKIIERLRTQDFNTKKMFLAHLTAQMQALNEGIEATPLWWLMFYADWPMVICLAFLKLS